MTNGYQTIDRRPKIVCACGCQQEATLNHFRIVEANDRRFLVLPACEKRFLEELAAKAHLRDIVTRCKTPWERVCKARLVYRLQRFVTERTGSRKTAWRTAAIYLLGQRLGFALSEVWR